ncbi:hypothetical protein [Longimicrobium sp.]|uniref:hypothetical protein n=1 Tax=Longimicrobium sp. TaxID=2029185 RepID=UPI002BE26DCD|nr:hypothetical protein [Longimicrobium sp.]HSU12956.1 hypothetical protein [Longimicrobium sp.]
MTRRIVPAAALAALASTRLAAQIAPETVRAIAPGTRIRVSAVAVEDRIASRDANDMQWRTGVLHEVTADGIVLQTNPGRADALVTVPFGVIQEVQVSRGNLDVRRGARRGVLQGAAAGGMFGVIVLGANALVGNVDCQPGFECDNEMPTGAAVAIVAGGTAGGALIGALVGTRAREVWEPAARHVSVAPARTGGTGVGLSFGF